YLAQVPREVRRVTEATGLEPLLAETLREQARHPDSLSFDMLDQRQQISSLRGSLESQLASVLFEIDCTGDTLEDLVHEFDRAEHVRELKLTIASLVTGAVAGVVAGVWDASDREGNGPPITAAIGAGATASLGVAAFLPRPRPVYFEHLRNVLSPIVQGDDPSHIYPTFVFRLLTLPMIDGSATPAQELGQLWRKLLDQAMPHHGRAQAEALLFGKGGTYAKTLLEVRATMLDQLESRVGALYRDLELLERYLTRVTAREALIPAAAAAGSFAPSPP
ncbi:MAG: hypothetical protein JWN04_5304, partial [Myxococcaceae bacterium]|nr:hypothetical protein [Myxococcaceae bacterium]